MPTETTENAAIAAVEAALGDGGTTMEPNQKLAHIPERRQQSFTNIARRPALDETPKFTTVRHSRLFIGFAFLDHAKLFRAAYKRQVIEIRGKHTEVFLTAVCMHDRITDNPVTHTHTFPSAEEAESYITSVYATMMVPYLMSDLFGTEISTNDQTLKNLEMDFVHTEFGE